MKTRDIAILITEIDPRHPLMLATSKDLKKMGINHDALPLRVSATGKIGLAATLTEVETLAGWLAAAIYVNDTEIQTAGLTWERIVPPQGADAVASYEAAMARHGVTAAPVDDLPSY